MRRYKPPINLILIALLSVCVFTHCSEDGCGPGECPPSANLDNLWPNDDGREWQFDLVQLWWVELDRSICEILHVSRDDVPTIPSLDEVEDMLRKHAVPDGFESAEGTYYMKFDGDSTTQSGVTAQALKDLVVMAGGGGVLKAPTVTSHAFLLRLAVARPDLLGRIMTALGGTSSLDPFLLKQLEDLSRPGSCGGGVDARLAEQIVTYPILIHGGAWEKTDEYIGTYGDIDTLLAYKFLEADLSPGHEFTHQLVPSLVDDVFLHCRVLPRTPVWVDGRPYPNAVECLYVIDYGISSFWPIPGGGDPSYCRLYDYGTVTYAPEVGPIYSYDRALVEAGNEASLGIGEKTLTIVHTREGAGRE